MGVGGMIYQGVNLLMGEEKLQRDRNIYGNIFGYKEEARKLLVGNITNYTSQRGNKSA